jgi:hypothetical protein
VVLAPHLDRGRIDEHVDERAFEGVANGEHLVVDGDDAVGGDPAKNPLTGVVLTDVDGNRPVFLGEGA